jgi:protein translocase SecG subunit
MSLLHIALIILALIIIVVTMLQAKGGGLSIIPGSGDFGKFERRGPEKVLHNITIGLIIAFIGLSLVSYFIA